jgi:predicted HTH domain antitoxin
MLETLPRTGQARPLPPNAELESAVGRFITEEFTLGQAAQAAGVSQTDLLRELGRRQIPIHYGQAELEADLATVAVLSGR